MINNNTDQDEWTNILFQSLDRFSFEVDESKDLFIFNIYLYQRI